MRAMGVGGVGTRVTPPSARYTTLSAAWTPPVAMDLIGLFVGAIVLSVCYKLFLAWLDQNPTATPET